MFAIEYMDARGAIRKAGRRGLSAVTAAEAINLQFQCPPTPISRRVTAPLPLLPRIKIQNQFFFDAGECDDDEIFVGLVRQVGVAGLGVFEGYDEAVGEAVG